MLKNNLKRFLGKPRIPRELTASSSQWEKISKTQGSIKTDSSQKGKLETGVGGVNFEFSGAPGIGPFLQRFFFKTVNLRVKSPRFRGATFGAPPLAFSMFDPPLIPVPKQVL